MLPESVNASPAPSAPIRVLFCGMRGAFSAIPLAALLQAGAHIVGVAVSGDSAIANPPIVPLDPPRSTSPLPLLNPHIERTLVQLAWQHDLPVIALNRPDSMAAHAYVADLRPDVAVVACFAQRIPQSLRTIPRFGFLNVHPSLLPAYRGPAPQFWVFRNGERATGVTIHVMDQGLDTGAIVAQAPLPLPDGISGIEAENRSAELGGQMLIEVIRNLANGTLHARPQPPGGSRQPWPQPADWTISATWPARRIFNFMRGTAEWDQPYIIDVAGERLALSEAVAFEPDRVLEAPLVRLGHTILIQCAPGVLTARLRGAEITH